MRTVIRYTATGGKVWSDNVPAAASMGGHHGSLVEGGPAGDSLYIPTKHEARQRANAQAARDYRERQKAKGEAA